MANDKKVVLITGAAAGIGLEAVVRSLLGSQTSYEILLSSRKLEQAQAAVAQVESEFPSKTSNVVAMEIDVESDASIETAVEQVKAKYGRLDALVNNAGLLWDFKVVDGSASIRQAWNKAWDVNVTGSHVMTHNFVPLLLASSDPRIVFITSSGATMSGTENTELPVNSSPSSGWPKTMPRTYVPSYRSSKMGMNMMMREWNRMLRNDGVKVWCVSPGFLATKLGGDQEANKKMGAGDPALGGEIIRDVLEGKRDDDVGKVVRRDGIQPW